MLERFPHMRILIEGHTSAEGSDDFNLRLSERRADAVKRHLVSRGIAPDRIETLGLGKSHPIADNDTEEGRALNRRIVFQVILR